MPDSFFTSRNYIDNQMQDLPPIVAEQFIEASVRRIAKIEGPLEAAKRLQRLADICAGAYVLPIEHWSKLGMPTSAAEPSAPVKLAPPWWRFDKRIDAWFVLFIEKYPMSLFYGGILFGMWLGGRHG